MIDHKHRQKIVLHDVNEDMNIAAACFIGSLESTTITKLLERQTSINEDVLPCYKAAPAAADQIASVLSDVNPILDENTLHTKLNDRNRLGQFQMSVGSTCASKGSYLFSNDQPVGVDDGSGDVDRAVGALDGDTQVPNSNDHPVGNHDGYTTAGNDEKHLLDDLYNKSIKGD